MAHSNNACPTEMFATPTARCALGWILGIGTKAGVTWPKLGDVYISSGGRNFFSIRNMWTKTPTMKTERTH